MTITDPQNWIALAAFLITAVTTGWLSARARERATESEQKGREVARLYTELQAAFEQASHAEALRQSERLKTALLDAVTHDIRTPLTSIKASVTALLDNRVGDVSRTTALPLDDRAQQELLEIIDEEPDRLDRFIGGLIELARIEAGELHLRRRWGALDDIVSTTLTRAETFLHERRVETDIEDGLPLVRVDPRAVSQILYTLVENAAKYSPADSPIRITARSCVATDGTAAVWVAVEDEGGGIPVESRERVFDKFFRLTPASVKNGSQNYQSTGTGVGLAIARGITEAHDGKIWIEDRRDHPGAPAHGTRVIFTLPLGEDEEKEGLEVCAESLTNP